MRSRLAGFVHLRIIRSLIILTSIVFLFACGGATLSIDSPRDGSLISDETNNIDINFTEAESSDLVVQLNGVDITGSLDVSAENASGLNPELLPGLNVLKVTIGGKTEISRFDYYVAGVPSGVTPLYTEKAYDQAIEDTYHSTTHDYLVKVAEARGYSISLAVPTEIVVSDSVSILTVQLHNTDIPGADKVSIVDIQAKNPQFSIDLAITTLHIQTGECLLEVVTSETHSKTFDLCAGSKVGAHKESLYGINNLDASVLSSKGDSSGYAKSGDEVGDLGDWGNDVIDDRLKGNSPGFGELADLLLIWLSLGGSNTDAINGHPSAGSHNDPHIISLDGVGYSNHLIGEMVLTRDKNGNGFEVQTRQEEVPMGCAAWNTAVSMRLDDNIVEYRVGSFLLVNSELVTLKEGASMTLDSGAVITNDNGIQAVDSMGNQVQLKFFNSDDHINVTVIPASLLANSVEGLLGDFDGNRGNDSQLRTGEITWDQTEFLEDWRISASESLFTYAQGESTDTYTESRSCLLTPSDSALNEAIAIYQNQCGSEPKDGDGLVYAMAQDLTAGLPPGEVTGLLGGICANGEWLSEIVFWNEASTVWSTFDTGLEGWTISGIDGFGWEDVSGEHGGTINIQDETADHTNFALAPSKYLGDWGHFSNQDKITFDIQYIPDAGATFDPFNYLIQITGVDGYATAAIQLTEESNGWVNLSVKIDPDMWVVSGDWDDILSNIQSLKLLVEFYDSGETVRLDNVRLTNTPNYTGDRVVLNIKRDEVTIERDYGSDLLLTIIESGDLFFNVENFFSDEQYEVYLEFSGGEVLSVAKLKQLVLETTDGPDNLRGYDTDDSLFGGVGEDNLDGGAGNDTLDGGTGDDTLFGGAGDDIYVFNLGYGNDTINNQSGNGGDKVMLDVTLSQVSIARDAGYSLLVTINETGDLLKVDSFFSDKQYEVNFEFSDGQVLSAAELKQWVLNSTDGSDNIRGYDTDDSLFGGAGEDNLDGGAGNDTLDGGTGDDTLFGGAGDDIYVFNLGYGNDTINNQSGDGGDKVMLDVTLSQVSIARDAGYSLLVTINETGDLLKVDNFFSDKQYEVNFEFSDGQVLSAAELKQWVLNSTDGSDNIRGYDTDDSLFGGAGEDNLDGGAGNDTLDGGTGDDTLFGGTGDDIYVFNLGYGNDTINNQSGDGGDKLMLNVTLSQVSIARDAGYSLLVIINETGDLLKVESFFSDKQYEVNFEFSDGKVLSAAEVKQLVL